MEAIRQYLLCVVSAGIICAVILKIVGEKGLLSSAIKLLAGLFMSITVISPIVKLQIDDFSDYLYEIETDSQGIVADGISVANDEKTKIIKQNLESYILDKASSLSVSLDAQITLSASDAPYPYSVILSGDISPYKRQQLQQIISNDLGIPEERQVWK